MNFLLKFLYIQISIKSSGFKVYQNIFLKNEREMINEPGVLTHLLCNKNMLHVRTSIFLRTLTKMTRAAFLIAILKEWI